MTPTRSSIPSIALATVALLLTGSPLWSDTERPAPVVILKMDDLTQRGADRAKGEAVSANFTAFVDTLRRLGVKASLGIIGNSLADGSPEYYAWIKALHEEGLVEFWNHGYTNQEFPRENGRRRTEFARASLESQVE